MEIHYKVTQWNKIILPNNQDNSNILKQLKEDGIHPVYIDYGENADNIEWQSIDNTEEQILPSENQNNPTVELMDWQEGILGLQSIWNNNDKF